MCVVDKKRRAWTLPSYFGGNLMHGNIGSVNGAKKIIFNIA
jgi:hypothetical protein